MSHSQELNQVAKNVFLFFLLKIDCKTVIQNHISAVVKINVGESVVLLLFILLRLPVVDDGQFR